MPEKLPRLVRHDKKNIWIETRDDGWQSAPLNELVFEVPTMSNT
jgi:hypothetical protein